MDEKLRESPPTFIFRLKLNSKSKSFKFYWKTKVVFPYKFDIYSLIWSQLKLQKSKIRFLYTIGKLGFGFTNHSTTMSQKTSFRLCKVGGKYEYGGQKTKVVVKNKKMMAWDFVLFAPINL